MLNYRFFIDFLLYILPLVKNKVPLFILKLIFHLNNYLFFFIKKNKQFNIYKNYQIINTGLLNNTLNVINLILKLETIFLTIFKLILNNKLVILFNYLKKITIVLIQKLVILNPLIKFITIFKKNEILLKCIDSLIISQLVNYISIFGYLIPYNQPMLIINSFSEYINNSIRNDFIDYLNKHYSYYYNFKKVKKQYIVVKKIIKFFYIIININFFSKKYKILIKNFYQYFIKYFMYLQIKIFKLFELIFKKPIAILKNNNYLIKKKKFKKFSSTIFKILNIKKKNKYIKKNKNILDFKLYKKSNNKQNVVKKKNKLKNTFRIN